MRRSSARMSLYSLKPHPWDVAQSPICYRHPVPTCCVDEATSRNNRLTSQVCSSNINSRQIKSTLSVSIGVLSLPSNPSWTIRQPESHGCPSQPPRQCLTSSRPILRHSVSSSGGYSYSLKLSPNVGFSCDLWIPSAVAVAAHCTGSAGGEWRTSVTPTRSWSPIDNHLISIHQLTVLLDKLWQYPALDVLRWKYRSRKYIPSHQKNAEAYTIQQKPTGIPPLKHCKRYKLLTQKNTQILCY